MLSHPHLPQLRELRAAPASKRATLAVAMIGFALIFAARVLDSDAANAEGALFVVPVGVLALRFGLRGGAWGALLALVLTAAWGLIDGVHLTTLGYATRALTIVALAMLLGNFVDRRRKLEVEVSRYYDASLDLLATADMHGHFTRVNPAWQRLLGYSPEELCARPFIDFVHADDREATIAQTAGLAQSVDTIGFRNRYRASDGSYRWLEWSASCASEGVIHAVARDVTAQHRSRGSAGRQRQGAGKARRGAHARARRRARGDAASAGHRGRVPRRRDLSAHRARRACRVAAGAGARAAGRAGHAAAPRGAAARRRQARDPGRHSAQARQAHR